MTADSFLVLDDEPTTCTKSVRVYNPSGFCPKDLLPEALYQHADSVRHLLHSIHYNRFMNRSQADEIRHRLLGPNLCRKRLRRFADLQISLRNMQKTNYIIAMARTPDPDTEKLTRQVIFMLQPSLFAEFEGACRARYKTVSVVLREMILKFVREKE